MGWGSGSGLMRRIMGAHANVYGSESEQDVKFYEELIEMFEDEDCDTLDECVGLCPAWDRAYNNLFKFDEDGYRTYDD